MKDFRKQFGSSVPDDLQTAVEHAEDYARRAQGGKGPGKPGKQISLKGPAGKIIGAIIAAVLVMMTLSGSFYNVSEQQQAIVMMFGQVVDVRGAGLYFKIPVIQNVIKVDTTTHGMPIGYHTDGANREYGSGAAYTTYEAEAIMITSDFNFVDVDFYLEYRVSDPVKYTFASRRPEEILRNIAQAAIRSTVSDYTVDDVITTGKSQIQSEVREKIETALARQDIGLSVVNITVQDAEPPTTDIMTAFKAVETAKQGADTSINNAKRYQSEQLPRAEAEADKIIQQAEASKAARIAEAEGQVERFNRMYDEYTKNPLITKQRLFYETMEDVLPGLKVIIDDGGVQTILPLDSVSTTTAAAAVEGGSAEAAPAE